MEERDAAFLEVKIVVPECLAWAWVQTIKAEVPDLTVNSWYLDDGTQVGTREQLEESVNI